MTQNELSLDPVSSTSRFIAHDLTSGELSLAPTNPLSHSNTITGCRLAKIHVDPPHSEEIDDMSVTGVDPVIAADISKLFKSFRGAQLTRPYPSFEGLQDVKSFRDVVDRSRIYLNVVIAEEAANAARDFYACNPRLSVDRINADTIEAQRLGIRAFLTQRLQAIEHCTYQPVPPLQPDLIPDLPSLPPRPSVAAQAEYHTLHLGGPLILPDGFVANGGRPGPRRDAGIALAIERLQQKDYELGLTLILPLDVCQQLFVEAGLPLHTNDDFLVRAVGKPEKRLVVNFRKGGLNSTLKKAFLAWKYMPILYPTHADICQLHGDVKILFPGRRLIMFKADWERWFKRIRQLIEGIGVCAQTIDINGITYAVLPLIGQLGCQDANYQSNLGGSFIYAVVRRSEIERFGGPVSLLYSDDAIGILPDDEEMYEQNRLAYRAISDAHAGTDSVTARKECKGRVLTSMGATYDMAQETVGLSEALFLKLVCLFFLELTTDITTKTKVHIKFLQRLGSFMCLTAQFIAPLRPFCHAVFENIGGRQSDEPIRLTHRSVIDIMYWRVILYSSFNNQFWLSAPIHVLPLLRPRHLETADQLAQRQAAAAHVIMYGDAAGEKEGSGEFGSGGLVMTNDSTRLFWFGHLIPAFREFALAAIAYMSHADHINFFEFITILIGLSNYCQLYRSEQSQRETNLLFHVWTDNSTAQSWFTKYKSHHPCNRFVLQVFSHLQCKYNITVTIGHIPGLLNVIADAISRQFKVPNGALIRQQLSPMTRVMPLPEWWPILHQSSIHQSRTPWQTAQDAHTALAMSL